MASQLNFDHALKTRQWGPPTKIDYEEETIDQDSMSLILYLISSPDLECDNFENCNLPLDKNVKVEPIDSGVEVSVKTEPSIESEIFWRPPKLEKENTYLFWNPGNLKWAKAKLVGIEGECLKLVTLASWELVWVISQHLAYPESPDTLMQVGTRVVAAEKKIPTTADIGPTRSVWTLGVVAEYPNQENRFRYLIMFDNGNWLYVQPEVVKPLHYQNKKIWRVLQKNRQEVKNYLNGKFKRKNYEEGDVVVVQGSNGTKKRKLSLLFHQNVTDFEYYNAIKVDCSLMLLWNQITGSGFWMHRGNTKLVS